MEIATRSKGSDAGSSERTVPKRRAPSPPHSSNGHSPTEASPSPVKKKKKPGAVNSSKDQSKLRHGPFYYVKQSTLTTDPVDVVPQDGRNDFYCWVCHREGQVLCCELCPRVYHAKCLKLAAEPEGDWFCPECEKITIAECIETQSKAMTMLTLEQLSYLLKFALQKMKQPGTEPFQKPVCLEQHPDYAEYIFHPMDLCTLEKNIKKKMYGSTEAFLADVKWILHNCIIYNGGNHKLTTTAKVIIKICEHEMNEIEVCPECYLSACQKRDNWFCEPCSNPHPLVWAKLKGFPFWPAKALRDKDGQVDARFFGQHDRAWVPINNCYLMSKEIPFSVKKTKSIFNSAMQEMEVYVENIRKKFGVFNYAPFRTPYTPDNTFQMLLDPANPSAGVVNLEKQDKSKFSFDMTASPKLMGKSMMSGGMSGAAGRRISVVDIPRSPTSTNSSDGEQDGGEKGQSRGLSQHHSTGEESPDSTASSATPRAGPAGGAVDGPKRVPNTPVKQDKTSNTGSILNLNLDRSKAEMDLKELSESVKQQQGPHTSLTSPKRQIRSRFQLNLDKTIESCKAQLGINEISEDAYKRVDHSDSDDSDKSDSSDSEYGSDDDQKPKPGRDSSAEDKTDKEPSKKKSKPSSSAGGEKNSKTESSSTSGSLSKGETVQKAASGVSPGSNSDKTATKAVAQSPSARDKSKAKEETRKPVSVDVDMDSDSERELVIDLGEEPGGKERKRRRKDSANVTALKEPTTSKSEGKGPPAGSLAPSQTPSAPSSTAGLKDPSQSPMAVPLNVVAVSVVSSSATSSALPNSTTPTALTSSTPAGSVKKQRPLLPRESMPVVQRAVVWNPGTKFQTSSQKWHMQKVQRQQQGQTQPQTQAQAVTQAQQVSSSAQQSSSTRYQTRQAAKVVHQKDSPHSTLPSVAALVTSAPVSAAIMAGVTVSSASPSTSMAGDLQIPTTSADIAADIAKYTNKIMDTIKGTVTEIYNDLSKSTSGNTVAEIRRLRIDIEKLQWLHQQELSEMKHNLELTMAEMRQSLEQERERLMAEVKKQMEMERQQAVDETKKKQWCANCKKEAIFYCCWNTSYCDYPCQQAHWPEHMKSCTQSATSSQQETETESSTDAIPKTSGHSNSGQDSPRQTASAPTIDKDNNTDKTKDSASVDLS
ncbi:MYND-type zinc finger-containing chromatin reader ZMYND8 isoform X2 [Trichomycterus rosablanca]